jgi:hypothetical protein
MLGEKAKSPKERALMAQQWQCFGSALENWNRWCMTK